MKNCLISILGYISKEIELRTATLLIADNSDTHCWMHVSVDKRQMWNESRALIVGVCLPNERINECNEPLIWAYCIATPSCTMYIPCNFPVHNSHFKLEPMRMVVWGWALKRKTDQFHNRKQRRKNENETKLTWKNLNNDYLFIWGTIAVNEFLVRSSNLVITCNHFYRILETKQSKRLWTFSSVCIVMSLRFCDSQFMRDFA